MSTYWWVNIACISVPLLASFHPRLKFWQQYAALFPAILLTAIVFILWDVWYTEMGVWGFNPMHIGTLKLANLPLEEVAFFICIPYACVFTYQVLKEFDPVPNLAARLNQFAPWIGLWLVLMAALTYDKMYTGPVFLSSGVLILLLSKVLNVRWLGYYLVSYGVLLIPFLISNGILTGSFIEQEVVWYNPAENLGWRIGTVPFEDLSYMNIMLLTNIGLFEGIKHVNAYINGIRLLAG